MNFKKHSFKRLLLLVFIILSVLIGTVMPAAAVMVKKPLEGKTISILGDSISTFENISCADAALTSNSTIKDNRLFYTDGRLGVGLNDTWWMQVTERLGGEILVNNSYSNSSVYDPIGNDKSQAYQDRCVNLHDNTGENSGEEPDIIIVYIGINDFSYNKDRIGTYSDINFPELISETSTGTTYAQPQTTCEAYAIMLHKIKERYKDSEVFCYNLPTKNNLSSEDYNKFKDYNKSIEKLCSNFGCHIVDLNSYIGNNSTDISKLFFYDGIHPNKNGMDYITSAFIDSFYKNSRYSDTSIKSYSIDYELQDVVVTNGKRYAVKENEALYCSLATTDGSPVNIKLTIDGVDYTNDYVHKGSINIPRVTGNILITATKQEDFIPSSYYFTVDDNQIQDNVSDEFALNKLSVISGTINGNNVSHLNCELHNTIQLKSNEPWSIVVRGSCSIGRKSHVISLNNYNSEATEGNQFISFDVSKRSLQIGYYSNGTKYAYGIDLSKHNLDIQGEHTYRLSNNTEDNKVYLYVDGKNIGSLNSYYVNDVLQKGTHNVSVNDIYINYLGSVENPITDMSLQYIKIWESSVPEAHNHSYEYNCHYELTCTEDERSESVCDCGDSIKEITSFAPGHKESKWLTSKTATVHSSGSAYKICETCGTLLDSKVLPQLKPDAPKIYSISNKTEGVKIDWYYVTGAKFYRVYRRGAGEGYWTYIATVTDNSYFDTTAKNNAYWRYTVRAGNEAGYGTYDNAGKYIKYVSAPHITKTENKTDGIQITWSSVYGATSYRVYRNRLGYSNWTYVGTTTSTNYLDKTIKKADGVYYRYTIRAVNAYYSDFEADTQYIKRLSTPTLIHAKAKSNGIEVKWQSVIGTTGYYIYRRTDKSGWVLIGSVGGTNSTTYIDKTAKKGVKYTYTVKACYGKHLSSYNTKGVSSKK